MAFEVIVYSARALRKRTKAHAERHTAVMKKYSKMLEESEVRLRDMSDFFCRIRDANAVDSPLTVGQDIGPLSCQGTVDVLVAYESYDDSVLQVPFTEMHLNCGHIDQSADNDPVLRLASVILKYPSDALIEAFNTRLDPPNKVSVFLDQETYDKLMKVFVKSMKEDWRLVAKV